MPSLRYVPTAAAAVANRRDLQQPGLVRGVIHLDGLEQIGGAHAPKRDVPTVEDGLHDGAQLHHVDRAHRPVPAFRFRRGWVADDDARAVAKRTQMIGRLQRRRERRPPAVR